MTDYSQLLVGRGKHELKREWKKLVQRDAVSAKIDATSVLWKAESYLSGSSMSAEVIPFEYFEFSVDKMTMRSYRSCREAIEGGSALMALYSDVLSPDAWSIERLSVDLERIIRRFDKSNLIEEARKGAESWDIDDETLDGFRMALESAGSLSALAETLQEVSTRGRFNVSSVIEHGSDLPVELLEKLMRIAVGGVSVPRTESFVMQPEPGPMRPIIGRLGRFVYQYALECVEKGLGIVMRVQDLRRFSNEELNFSGNLHAVIQDKVRMIHDHSNCEDETIEPLNSEATKVAARETYGPILHPTIESIVTRVLMLCEKLGIQTSELRFASIDVKNAFGKMKIAAKDVALMPILIDELRKLALVRFMCSFGKSEYPFGYDTFSKCLEWKINDVIDEGIADIYVDDCFLFSIFLRAHENLRKAIKVHHDLLGLDSLNEAKCTASPTIDGVLIGWYINLEKGILRPSEKAMDKLKLMLFVILDVEAIFWELRHVQGLVSLVIRYAKAMSGMSCLTQPFVDMLRQRGGDGPGDPRAVSVMARCALQIWRSAVINGECLSVPLRCFDQRTDNLAEFITINDAANSLGCGVYRLENGYPVLSCYTAFKLPFLLPDAKFQNVKELMGCLLSLLLIAMFLKAPKGTTIRMQSDSMSSLSWLGKNRANSE